MPIALRRFQPSKRYAPAVNETSALFDFHHPLAGQALAFEVQVIGILSSSA
jgi:FKBP-type peptidyl-prolyl cis-trans isomerase 2